ncbi:MAG: hypothetical protein ACREMZ_07160 [Gemmatimonadales bacterium]
MARLRASVFAALVVGLVGCDTTDSLSPDDGTLPETGVTPASLEEPSLAAVRFAGGIPIGHHGQPLTAFGRYHNGAKMNIAPGALRSYLAAIKARGGKVVLMLAGNDKYYKDSRGFNLNKWKARVDRYKGINFSSYIKDGTVIGHFLVDEPNDPNNWNGRTISPSVVDEMARHSKQRWAGMPTLARVEPSYFRNYRARYLDGAWAQYVTRKGSASDYIRRNVADAQRADLSLVVGLNISKGGPNKRRLTPSQVKSFGSALLASSYPCAFISWTYGSYLTTGSMLDAMRFLRSKAQSRGTKTCRG